MIASRCEVAIVGAGPYGLSAAAHLQSHGVDTKIFGYPMEFWERQMPAGMRLRSSWAACHLSDPQRRLTLDDYEREIGATIERPVPLKDFLAYTRWFQGKAVPDIDRREAVVIRSPVNGSFQIELDDRKVVEARRVVIATGISRFAHRPAAFKGLPRVLVSHSSDHSDLSCFGGRTVLVVGAGQSAIESAALLSERGADVEVVARAARINWLTRSSRLHHLPSALKRLLYHHTDVGPALLSQLIACPNLFRRLPIESQKSLAYRAIRPAASGWLKPLVENVRFSIDRTIAGAARSRDKICIRLSDDSTREVDHVLLATGYRVDISRYCFLSRELLNNIKCVAGYPQLSRGLESSIPGLHFLGATAAYSFGPLMRFVSGTEFASRSLSAEVMRARSNGRHAIRDFDELISTQ